MPDYSKQLSQIIDALNRPSTPAWEIALLSAMLAVFGGLLGQFLLMLMKDARERRQLRAHLYRDLASLFFSVHRIMDLEPEQIPWEDKFEWLKDQLKRELLFRGEKECIDNQRLYMQLPERLYGDALYARFHRIIDELEQGHGAVNMNTRSALRTFAWYVHEGKLEARYFKKYLSKQSADSLLMVLNQHSEKRYNPPSQKE